MLYKRCTRCGKRLEYSAKCSCFNKYKTNSDDYKLDVHKKFYKSKEWQRLANRVKTRYNHIDIYSYYTMGIIEHGEVVHHIVPLVDDFGKRFDYNNLIYLTESNHRKIHNIMRKSIEDKVYIQNVLRECMDKFLAGRGY